MSGLFPAARPPTIQSPANPQLAGQHAGVREINGLITDCKVFPALMGWNCFGDDEKPQDQRCDSVKPKRLPARLRNQASESTPAH